MMFATSTAVESHNFIRRFIGAMSVAIVPHPKRNEMADEGGTSSRVCNICEGQIDVVFLSRQREYTNKDRNML